MTKDNTPLLTFPCEFPIKIIGKACDSFEIATLAIIHKHFPELTEGAIKTRKSKDGNYLAMTLTVTAMSQQQLDDIYQELSAHDEIIMVL